MYTTGSYLVSLNYIVKKKIDLDYTIIPVHVSRKIFCRVFKSQLKYTSNVLVLVQMKVKLLPFHVTQSPYSIYFQSRFKGRQRVKSQLSFKVKGEIITLNRTLFFSKFQCKVRHTRSSSMTDNSYNSKELFTTSLKNIHISSPNFFKRTGKVTIKSLLILYFYPFYRKTLDFFLCKKKMND